MKCSVKLTLLFTGIMLLSGILISYLVYSYNIKTVEKLIKDRLENQAFHAISKVDMMLHERGEDIKKIVSDPIFVDREVSPEKILKRLNEFNKLNNDFDSLSFFDLNRVRIADTSGKDLGIQHPLTNYWKDLNREKEFVLDISGSESLNKPVIHFAAFVKDKNGTPFGVVVTRSPIQQISEIVQQAVGIFDGKNDFKVDLIDKDGLVLYSNYIENRVLKEKIPDLDYLREHFKGALGGSLRHTHPGQLEEFLAFAVEPGYDSFKGNNWRLIINMSSEKAFAPVKEIRRNIIIILVLISAFSIFLISVFSRTVTRPIEALSDASAEIKSGNLDVSLKISSKDEISKLAASFNEMAGELKISRDRMLSYSNELEKGIADGTKRLNETNEQLQKELAERKQIEEALRKNEEHFRVFMNFNPGIAWIKDDEFRFVYVNPRMETIFKRSLNDWTGKTDFDLYPDETAKKLRENDEYVISSGAGIETEEVIALPDGKLRHWEVFKFPLLESSGRYFLGGMAIDITDRKFAEDALLKAKNELEANVLERTAELAEANTKLSARAQELEELNRQSTIFGNMIELLQACNEIDEAYSIISKSFSHLFPADSGGLYIINPSKNLVEAVSVWGESPPTEKFFVPDDCWSLRRGQTHIVSDPKTGVICRHGSYTDSASVCVPLFAQGEPLGVLFLSMEPRNYSDVKGQLIASLAEQTGLAISNLRLRDTLRNLSIRDPLTGLYNRRYLEESITREMSRSARNGKSMGLIMIDIDHFKKFNDTYGHDAGDNLLREFGLLIMKNVRDSDIACRYGGEEFSVILPETSMEVALNRAEHLREEVKRLHVKSGGQLFRQITISSGIAVFPIHGSTKEELSIAADTALYKAKRNGRDQIVIAERRLPETYNQGKLFVIP